MEIDGNKLYLDSQLYEGSANNLGVIVNKKINKIIWYSLAPYVPFYW